MIIAQIVKPEKLSSAELSQLNNMGTSFLATREFILSIAILIFGMLMAGIGFLLKEKLREETSDHLRYLVLVVIACTGAFVILSGYSDNQIAPVFGLLGTALGYILGKEK